MADSSLTSGTLFEFELLSSLISQDSHSFYIAMDENHLSKQLKEAFGDKTLYEILEVDKKASDEEIKRSYKKLALKYHPDKGGSAELFKALSVAHSILSDAEKRKIYDQNGDVDSDEATQEFEHWYEYFRNLFPKLTIEKIEEFSDKYKGSEEEKGDVIKAYNEFNGDLKKIMDCVMLAEEGDEGRICDVIDVAIESKELKATASYNKSKKAAMNSKPKKRKVSEEDSMAALAQLIQSKNKQSSGASAMSSIFAKYGGGEDDSAYNISEEAFQKTKAKMSKKK